MSLSELRSVISRLSSYTNDLSDHELGNSIWRKDFLEMLFELDITLKDMDNRIGNLEQNQIGV